MSNTDYNNLMASLFSCPLNSGLLHIKPGI